MNLLPARCPLPLDTVVHADLLTLCSRLEPQSVDMILADLPYQVTQASWDMMIPLEPMWAAFKRVMKPRGAIVLTATEPFASWLRMSAFDLYKYDWVWIKSRPTDFIRAKLKPMNIYELVLIFSCGTVANASPNQMNYFPQGLIRRPHYHKRDAYASKNVVGRRPSHVTSYWREDENYPDNVLRFPSVHNVGSYHPNEKPVALFEYLIRTYTQPGELVLDPTCGSGTTAIAARNIGRHFICGDLLAEYVAVARERLRQPFTLPMFDRLPITERVSA